MERRNLLSQADAGISDMVLEYERVKRELEQMREMKEMYEELRKNHEKLQARARLLAIVALPPPTADASGGE